MAVDPSGPADEHEQLGKLGAVHGRVVDDPPLALLVRQVDERLSKRRQVAHRLSCEGRDDVVDRDHPLLDTRQHRGDLDLACAIRAGVPIDRCLCLVHVDRFPRPFASTRDRTRARTRTRTVAVSVCGTAILHDGPDL